MEEYKTNEMTSSGQSQFPQFGTPGQNLPLISPEIQERIDAAKANGWGAQLKNTLLRNKKGAIIAVAVLLLFALGSYISKNNADNLDNTPNNKLALPTQSTALPAVLPIELNAEGNVVISQEATSITKTANHGEGITHLARYALRDYLEETGESLSAEQKIYAEDYIQNKTGEEMLNIGESLSFSREFLADAVLKANALEQWQIENLKQYSITVSLL